MGYYDDGKLRYAGRVGTGCSRAIAGDPYERLRIDSPAFDVIPAAERRRRGVRWVEPKLVAAVHFRGWTGTRMLRHAAFKGLREDKDAREVVGKEPSMNPTRQADSGAGTAGARGAVARPGRTSRR